MVRKTEKPGPHEEPLPAGEENGLIWGLNPVIEALRNPRRGVHEVLAQRDKGGPRLQELIALARERNIPLRFVPSERLGAPPGARHQGVSARLTETVFWPLEALLSGHKPLVLLDCIQDPRNLGSIMRSALAAGFERIILPKERSALLGGAAAKCSAGAISLLQLSRVSNVAQTLQTLKTHGYWIFGAVVEPGAPSLYHIDFPKESCLVLGGEAKGIRPLVRQRCDQLFTIPMAGSFDSLNVSAAAAVIFFEWARRWRERA